MSFDTVRTYREPRVEDVFSEAGDNSKPTQNTKRLRKPAYSASNVKPDPTRSASDSGYSSKTDNTTASSAVDARKKDAIAHDLPAGNVRSTPYTNMHQPGKESIGTNKNPKPRPNSMTIPGSRAEPGAMPPPPLPPSYQHPYPPNGSQVRPPMPLRVNTLQPQSTFSPSSPLYPPRTPQFYHQGPTSAFPQQPGPRQPPYTSSAPPTAGPSPNYFQPQPAAGGYLPSQAGYSTSPPNSYQPQQFPIQPPVPTPTFAQPDLPQRPAPVKRQTAPVVRQAYGQQTFDPNQLNFEALAVAGSLDKQQHADNKPFLDLDNKIKCYRKGVLYAYHPPRPRVQKRVQDRKRHRRTRKDVDSESSSCSTCDSNSESELEQEQDKGRVSPRKALDRTQSLSSKQQAAPKGSRPASFASSRNSGEQYLEREKQKLSDVEEYQKQTSTPPRRQTAAPAYLEDTARATKAPSSGRSSVSQTARSPTRSRNGESGGDSRRDSLIMSTKGGFTMKQIEEGLFHFDPLDGQEIIVTINNSGQRTEKAYYTTGSSGSGRRPERQTSTASTNWTQEASDVRRPLRP